MKKSVENAYICIAFLSAVMLSKEVETSIVKSTVSDMSGLLLKLLIGFVSRTELG